MLLLSAAVGLAGTAVAVGLTWPENSLGAYLHARRSQAEVIRLLGRRISAEPDPLVRAFYQAWQDEEQGDVPGAIRGFDRVARGADPDSSLALHATLRLGQSYGHNRQPEQELAVYRGLMERHPGASRLSQAFFHLRRKEHRAALDLLEEALAQDARDGSLGGYRELAESIRRRLAGPGPAAARPRP